MQNNPKNNFQPENFQERLLFKKMYLMSFFPSVSEKASPRVGGGKVRTWDWNEVQKRIFTYFQKECSLFFFFLPAFWILLTSLNKIKYCILDVVKKTQQNKNWLLTTLRLILLLKKNLQHVQMVIGLLCSGGLWRYKGIRIRERGTRLWCSRHCSKHLTYITSFDPHSNLWGLLLTLFEFYRKRNQGWESNFNKISRMLSVQAGQSVTWAWSLARQALLKLYAQICKNTP